MIPRYGVLWPDGTYTGGITDKHAWAAEYARISGFNGRAYTVGGEDDPETKAGQPVTSVPLVLPVNIWRAP